RVISEPKSVAAPRLAPAEDPGRLAPRTDQAVVVPLEEYPGALESIDPPVMLLDFDRNPGALNPIPVSQQWGRLLDILRRLFCGVGAGPTGGGWGRGHGAGPPPPAAPPPTASPTRNSATVFRRA